MASTLSAHAPADNTQQWMKAIGIALLIVVLLVGIGGAWLLRDRQPRASAQIERDLLRVLDTESVPPHLPLLMLAEYPPDQVWQEPLRRAQWDGALAMWLFGPVRPDSESVQALLAMATAQQRTDPNRAAALLLAAADVVRLSPELSDRQRAEWVVEVGEQFRDIGLPGAAVTEWRQASILAHYSPTMPPLYRRTLLHDLATRYRAVGAKKLEARARENVAQVGSSNDVQSVPERIVLDTEELPPEPDDLIQARQRRRQAAQTTAQALDSQSAALPLAYAELRDALSAEGLLHRLWVEEQLRLELQPEARATLLLFHINWLQRERMLAWGVGGPAFATWVERRPSIEAALHETWNALEEVRIEQSIRDGQQLHATLAQREWWAVRLVQGRLDRDPALDNAALLAAMRPNNADPGGQETLRLDWIQGRFWRVPRELVGTDRLPE